MAFDLVFKNDSKICITNYSGNISIDDIAGVHKQRQEKDDNCRIEVIVTNLLDASLSDLFMNDIKSLANDAKNIASNCNYKLVIGVAENELEAGFSKLWQVYTHALDIDSYTVSTLEDAEKLVSDYFSTSITL